MKRLSLTTARFVGLGTVANDVKYAGERYVVVSRGRPVAAIVSVEDLELVQWLEDAVDLSEVRARIADGGQPVSWELVKKDLNL